MKRLKTEITKTVSDFPISFVQDRIRAMPKIMRAVIEKKGNETKYWITNPKCKFDEYFCGSFFLSQKYIILKEITFLHRKWCQKFTAHTNTVYFRFQWKKQFLHDFRAKFELYFFFTYHGSLQLLVRSLQN